MDLSITQVPSWVSILFFISFITVPVFLIANTAKTAYQKEELGDGSAIYRKIVLFYWAYLVIIALVSLIGFFAVNTLPPRIIVFSAVPLFLFYIFYVQRTIWFKQVFQHIKIEQLIFIHIFRLVGVFFFINYYYDVLPKSFAFIGGTGDIVTAILVFPIVTAIKNKAIFAKPLAFIWNIIGLIDIVSVLSTAIIITRAAIANDELGVQQFGTFPFSWIPAFAPATIIFLHILIFRKLRAWK